MLYAGCVSCVKIVWIVWINQSISISHSPLPLVFVEDSVLAIACARKCLITGTSLATSLSSLNAPWIARPWSKISARRKSSDLFSRRLAIRLNTSALSTWFSRRKKKEGRCQTEKSANGVYFIEISQFLQWNFCAYRRLLFPNMICWTGCFNCVLKIENSGKWIFA